MQFTPNCPLLLVMDWDSHCPTVGRQEASTRAAARTPSCLTTAVRQRRSPVGRIRPFERMAVVRVSFCGSQLCGSNGCFSPQSSSAAAPRATCPPIQRQKLWGPDGFFLAMPSAVCGFRSGGHFERHFLCFSDCLGNKRDRLLRLLARQVASGTQWLPLPPAATAQTGVYVLA